MLAQGGPPMITDDPGTPGGGKWEINLGWTTQRTPGATLCGLPQLDANYGIGDRIELTYLASYLGLKSADEPPHWGAGESEFAVKWRFVDKGEHGLQISAYPQINFLTPGSHSDRRGLADTGTSWQLPFEIGKDFGNMSVNIDLGRVFSPGKEANGWFGGVCVGREVAKGWELDAEVHADADERAGRAEWIANVGSRVDFSEHATVLLAIGRDLGNRLGPKVSLLSYVGMQLRF